MSSPSSAISWPPQYKIKRHRFAKRVKLRASQSCGLEITVPYRFNLNHMPSILEDNKCWIMKHLALLRPLRLDILPQQIEFAACDEIWKIDYVSMNTRLTLTERYHLKEIVLAGNMNESQLCRAKLIFWLKIYAKLHLPRLLHDVSMMMALRYSKVTVRSQKTVWGSCSIDKAINLNYKLLFLPKSLARHVMIHELSHIVHYNHSAQFWNLVAQYDADWKAHRRALRQASQLIPEWVA